MFTLCLGFLVFAGVMLELQSQSIIDNVRQFVGSYSQRYVLMISLSIFFMFFKYHFIIVCLC